VQSFINMGNGSLTTGAEDIYITEVIGRFYVDWKFLECESIHASIYVTSFGKTCRCSDPGYTRSM
jgi:hypothetical protein